MKVNFRGTKIILLIWLFLEILLISIFFKGILFFKILYLGNSNISFSELISYSLGVSGFLFGIYRYFDFKELKQEHKSHFDYISHIIEQNNISINRSIFTSFEEAKEEYKKYKKG